MPTLIIPLELLSDDMDMQKAEYLNELYKEGRFDEFNNTRSHETNEEQHGVAISDQ